MQFEAYIDVPFEPIDESPSAPEPQEPQTNVRRAPHGGRLAKTNKARITMDLESWLEVDRRLHELHTLVEVAISQRDDARDDRLAKERDLEALAVRLREWRIYSKKLEHRLYQLHMENLELTHAVKGSARIAAQALTLGAFQGRRRAELRDRLKALGEGLSRRR